MPKYNISFSPPDVGMEEVKAASEAILSGWITTGPKTKEFERQIAEYCGADKAACLNSATAALELSLRVLGIGKGDEVITSAYTYTASASVICHVGATPVLVDTAKDSFFMDYDKLKRAITRKTKAIIPIDIAGVPCDYTKIYDAIKSANKPFKPRSAIAADIGRIAVVADCAHSFGAIYSGKRSGTAGDFNCFSFHAVKNLTTAEGGAVTFSAASGFDCEEVYKQFMLLSLHGQSKDALAKSQLGSWEYDILSPAYKCNMTDITAAIGIAQLARYDDMLFRRRELIDRYNKSFEGTDIIPLAHSGDSFLSSGHLYLTGLAGKDRAFRDRAIIALAEQGVSANVHYKPLPMLTAYKNMGFKIEKYPNALSRFENELTLPLNTIITNDEVDYVADCLKDIMRK